MGRRHSLKYSGSFFDRIKRIKLTIDGSRRMQTEKSANILRAENVFPIPKDKMGMAAINPLMVALALPVREISVHMRYAK